MIEADLYVVTLYRQAERNNESFVVGAFSSINAAVTFAKNECFERGFKYGYEITCIEIDSEENSEELPEIVNPHGNPNW